MGWSPMAVAVAGRLPMRGQTDEEGVMEGTMEKAVKVFS